MFDKFYIPGHGLHSHISVLQLSQKLTDHDVNSKGSLFWIWLPVFVGLRLNSGQVDQGVWGQAFHCPSSNTTASVFVRRVDPNLRLKWVNYLITTIHGTGISVRSNDAMRLRLQKPR